jgi:hypothetical protein
MVAVSRNTSQPARARQPHGQHMTLVTSAARTTRNPPKPHAVNSCNRYAPSHSTVLQVS